MQRHIPRNIRLPFSMTLFSAARFSAAPFFPVVFFTILFFMVLLSGILQARDQVGPAKQARPTPQVPAVTASVTMPEIVAEVGEDKILKNHLAAEALRQFGPEMLKDEIKRQLIFDECQKRNIQVTQEEINAEIKRLAETYDRSTEDWLKLIEEQKGCDRTDYIENLIAPLLALTKLAGQRLEVDKEEIRREFESRFGPSVQVRQIVLPSKAEAERARAEVVANPDSFESVAKNLSIDTASKPYGGLLHPIRRHAYQPIVEQTAFALKPGEISQVFEWPEGFFVVFKCEQHYPAQDVDIAKVQAQLELHVRNEKIRKISGVVFDELMDRAKIDVLLTDPARSKQHPDVAAVVNGQTISTERLADRCVRRHGKTLLNEMIGKLLVEQECRKRNITISNAEIDDEIREMAVRNLPLLQDGTPDIPRWLAQATTEAGVSVDIYRTNTVWPMLAMKKMVRAGVQVTQDDVQKGYEANFGPQVRCLAIFMRNEKHAMDVWNKATRLPTEENFGDLAEQFSIDDSRLVRGVIPSIRNYGGYPTLEKEAFRLAPGEISSIVQEGGVYVILYCQGRTDATDIPLADVQADIVADIYDKKLNLAVAALYERLLSSVRVYNYLDGRATGPISADTTLPDAGMPAR